MSSVAPAIARLFSFVADTEGAWRVEHIHGMAGASLSAAPRVSVVPGPVVQLPPGAAWSLRGLARNERYFERAENAAVTSKQAGLGRESSTCAALIPLRKNAPGDADAFAEMLLALRASPEWAYVEREADIRLVRPIHTIPNHNPATVKG